MSSQPSAQALRHAALHQQAGRVLATIDSTGIAKGVYRFSCHEQADAQRLEGLIAVVAANAAALRRRR